MSSYIEFTLFTFGVSYGEHSEVVHKKNQLKELDDKINKLKQVLTHAHDKQTVLTQELSHIEKSIGQGVKNLQLIQQTITNKQQNIQELQREIDQLSNQLRDQQQLLAKHIRTRYRIGVYQPLKWLLNQENPYLVSRLLTFYQYLIKSREEAIHQVRQTKKQLALDQDKLNQEMAAQKHLQQQLVFNQQKLSQEKHYQTNLIHSLQQEIHSKQQALQDHQTNKENLTRLLASLVQKSMMQNQVPFARLRHKLPKPVTIEHKSLQKINQGIIFFAQEGTPVKAVYPGKVLFSDWLKGYGLLLIVDHGQGFMTLYAHNQSLFKQKGEMVGQGEQIATVGHSGGLIQNGLYFEVRQRGKAVPPLEWLS
ncbi:membrane-bound metallopeptidase [Legionella oakridgensis ATCC 33761 = DSM 21215]|uniref:Membrane-bound metallopeptidase n=1 Tax=Legionella oakridgensis ATCC 33761 = DSM 21215 TaxID=1268635 RepID=W0BBI9_9GAMM|nr:peptidoglycan DD-metalloendopeptidase family protein [Legionella oakridgensis]AHE67888.1 membrane-bound metallopeptidase [Legionella oakridgensis ATCC 33761 = DSM 21215]